MKEFLRLVFMFDNSILPLKIIISLCINSAFSSKKKGKKNV